PTPTPTPPPTTGSCTTQVWQQLEACGWPGPTNTGYPAGTALTNTSGRTISASNVVIDGEKITGGLTITGQNVTIKNSWITKYVAAGEAANGTGVINVKPGASAIIDHVTLDGQDGTHACVWHEGTSVTIKYVNCYGANDGIFSWKGDNFTINDNYIHNLSSKASNGHIDGFQTEGAANGTITHNTIDVNAEQNAAVSIWNSLKTSNNIAVSNNLLAGGGFTVYAQDSDPSQASPSGVFTVTNVTFTNNKFSRVHYGCIGFYGVWYTRGAPTDGWRRTGNTILETGTNIDNGNPTYNGSPCN
ncbi:MAG TPA: right-handed parallel beta-helix repeat-containing protein, partial [Candidatus Saccharimonadales bacterium]|nr:right-handed parallel beta-helix repeat-containing protein [Candidatus Saccharimonadales bacterium]